MKLRQGFVSNSSSTSFTFIFKGKDMEALFNKMIENSAHFDLYSDTYGLTETKHITVNDVIDAVRSNSKGNLGEYDAPICIKISEAIKKAKKNIKDMQKWEDESIARGNGHDQYYIDEVFNLTRKLSQLEDLKKKGFKTVAVIGFGDSHGLVSGMDVGSIMDYEGRYIHINKPDFVVYTDQNR
jgi:Icc-related predicted phosphoesterase